MAEEGVPRSPAVAVLYCTESDPGPQVSRTHCAQPTRDLVGGWRAGGTEKWGFPALVNGDPQLGCHLCDSPRPTGLCDAHFHGDLDLAPIAHSFLPLPFCPRWVLGSCRDLISSCYTPQLSHHLCFQSPGLPSAPLRLVPPRRYRPLGDSDTLSFQPHREPPASSHGCPSCKPRAAVWETIPLRRRSPPLMSLESLHRLQAFRLCTGPASVSFRPQEKPLAGGGASQAGPPLSLGTSDVWD